MYKCVRECGCVQFSLSIFHHVTHFILNCLEASFLSASACDPLFPTALMAMYTYSLEGRGDDQCQGYGQAQGQGIRVRVMVRIRIRQDQCQGHTLPRSTTDIVYGRKNNRTIDTHTYNTYIQSYVHTYAQHPHPRRERERERDHTSTHTHTHAHAQTCVATKITIWTASMLLHDTHTHTHYCYTTGLQVSRELWITRTHT